MCWTPRAIKGATRFAESFMLRRFGRRQIKACDAEDFVMSLVATGFKGSWKRALACDIIDAYRSERGRRRARKDGKPHPARKFVPLPCAGQARADKEPDHDLADLIASMRLDDRMRQVVWLLVRGETQRLIALRLGLSEGRVSQLVHEIRECVAGNTLWRDLVASHSRRLGKQVESSHDRSPHINHRARDRRARRGRA